MNKYQYKVQGVDYDVEIVDVEGNIAKVSVNGIPFEVELKEPIKASHLPKRPAVKHQLLLLLQVLVQRCWLRCLEPSRKSR